MEHSLEKKAVYSMSALLVFLVIVFLFFGAPKDFPVGATIRVEEGMSLRSVSLKLKNENVIRSRVAFEAFVILYGGEKHLIPVDYFFDKKNSVFEVARRISTGDRNLAPIKVTIPEGFNMAEIAEAFSGKLPNFNKERFLLLASGKEGYLFPDTYFFFNTDTEEDALISMEENFAKKLKSLESDILSSGKSEKNILIMASIIEREADGDQDREFISGILWKRLAIGRALEVDAAPETYRSVGLPKAPICNPGLEAINAAIFPKDSPYLYYLHDKDGNIHYAQSFEEHRGNIEKYLR